MLHTPRFALATLVLLAPLSATSLAGVSTVALDGSGDFTTLRDAIVAASDGDTILVRGGLYFDAIHIDGKSLAILAQDPQNPPRIRAAGASPEIFIIENLSAGQEVVLDSLNLIADGWDNDLSAFRGSLTIRDCGGQVRVQNCDLQGAEAMCAGGGSASHCSQTGGAHVSNSDSVFFVNCSITAGRALCWEDSEGTVSCGGNQEPALVVEGSATRVALHDCHVFGPPGIYPGNPDYYHGWDGGPAAEVTDCFLFTSNSVFQGGPGSDGRDSTQGYLPGNGGDGGPALLLSNAVVKELNSLFIGGAAATGGVCTNCTPPVPPGTDGQPGPDIAGCCVESLTGAIRTSRMAGNQLLPGVVEVTFLGVPGDVVDLLASETGGFTYQAQRLGVLALSPPLTLLGGAGGL